MNEGDMTSTEARWRNYQKLLWTQQQIHLQIQQQQQQQQQQPFPNPKMNAVVGPEAAFLDNPLPLGMSPAPTDNQTQKAIDAAKDTSDPWDNFDAQAAFLGPSLWDKRLPYDGQDFKLEYVDLEEFLNENGIPMDTSQGNNANGRNPQQRETNSSSTPISPMHEGRPAGSCMQSALPTPENLLLAGPSSRIPPPPIGQNPMLAAMANNPLNCSRSPSPCGSASSGISHDMSSDTSPESTQSTGEGSMGMNAYPGHEFDPRTRSFTEDELKPQPMVKKSKKQFVPDEAKDNKYWARRRKNNMAAKRSRDARRVKENQIAMRACYLEKESVALRVELERMQKENILLKEQLRCCRRDH